MSRHSAHGKAWERTRLRVLDRDGYVCAYCGREADTVDHIVAKANGGSDDISNLVSSCRRCNAAKGARTQVRTAYVNRRWLDRL